MLRQYEREPTALRIDLETGGEHRRDFAWRLNPVVQLTNLGLEPIRRDWGRCMTTTRAISVMTLADVLRHSDLRFAHADTDPLPASPGVYCHVDPLDGAVLYIGSAAGNHGLRRRLGSELNWIAATAGDDGHLSRRTNRAAVIAGLVEHRTQAHYAITATGADARAWERRLVHLSVLLTGAPPLLRGWDVRGASAEAFHWVRARLQP